MNNRAFKYIDGISVYDEHHEKTHILFACVYTSVSNVILYIMRNISYCFQTMHIRIENIFDLSKGSKIF